MELLKDFFFTGRAGGERFSPQTRQEGQNYMTKPWKKYVKAYITQGAFSNFAMWQPQMWMYMLLVFREKEKHKILEMCGFQFEYTD